KKAFNELNVAKTTVIGGKKVVSSKIANSVPKAKRVSGSNRFGTAVAIAKHFPKAKNDYYATTGMKYPDALAGAALAAKENTGILLVHSKLPKVVGNFVTGKKLKNVSIIGGADVDGVCVGRIC